jgi:hypothetical protein
MHAWAAFAASALFAFQPLLWGHAFINPKDPPFLVFLSGSIYLGFRMVDQLTEDSTEKKLQTPSTQRTPRENEGTKKRTWPITFLQILLPAFILGIATSIRVLGPMAGLFVVIYFLTRHPTRQAFLWMGLYAALSIVVMLATWPYLWESPLRFVQVFQFMSDNPTGLQVLFADQIYRAFDLPLRYIPFYLFFTLTEPVWPFFAAGLLAAAIKFFHHREHREHRDSSIGDAVDFPKLIQAALIFAWFIIPLAYDILRNPPDFDGMRHFLFMLPPVFIFAGFAFEWIFQKINRTWINAALVIVLLAPGIVGIIQLHPYEYTYYNSFIGGTGGVFRHYETDYWLTCYKQAVQEFDQEQTGPVNLYVHREAEVAAPYASSNVTVLDERGALTQIKPGDFVLVNTRSNEDQHDFHGDPIVLSVGRAGATFCVIKKVP